MEIHPIANRFVDTAFRVFDDGDATKLLAFQLSGVTTGNTRTLTVPDVSTNMWADNGSVPLTANWDVGNFTLTASGLTLDGTFTDGTLSIASGSITSAVNGTFTSTVQAEHLYSTDDMVVDDAIKGGKFYTTNATEPAFVDSVALGNGSDASYASGGCAAFLGGTASGSGALAFIGDATGGSSITLGLGSEANDDKAISIGANVLAEENSTIAIGSYVTAGVSGGSSATGAIVIGYNKQPNATKIVSTGEGSIVIGSQFGTGRSTGMLRATADGAIVIGTALASQTTEATAANAIAIGQNITNSTADSILLGIINAVIELHDNEIGFFGTAPATRSTGYTTFTNLNTDRTCDANATSVAELADILGTLIEDLKSIGLIAA